MGWRRPEAPRKRVVATGVQNHDVQPVLRLFHLRQREADVHSFIFHFGLAVDHGADGDHVIGAADLRAVPGEIEHPDATFADLPAKLADHVFHLATVAVLAGRDFKPELAKPGGHIARVVDRIVLRAFRIRAIADDQRNPRLGSGRAFSDALPALLRA